jgi:hypothetical protein
MLKMVSGIHRTVSIYGKRYALELMQVRAWKEAFCRGKIREEKRFLRTPPS